MTREEAIRRIKAWNLDSDDREVLAVIIPELRESEDERIRKVIYKLLLGMREEIFTSQDEIVTKEKVLAWLEKQKKPHYTKRNALFDKCVAECDPEIMQRVSDEIDEMLEKEQKPAEWSEEDEYRREGVVEWLRDHQKTIDRNSNNQAYESIESLISWLKSLHPSWKPSEEQMDALNALNCHGDSLEEAAYKYSFDSRPSIYGQVDVIDAFKSGAEWKKEQMLKDAVEGEVYDYGGGSFGLIARWLDMPNEPVFKSGEKVRIVVLKAEEEEK